MPICWCHRLKVSCENGSIGYRIPLCSVARANGICINLHISLATLEFLFPLSRVRSVSFGLTRNQFLWCQVKLSREFDMRNALHMMCCGYNATWNWSSNYIYYWQQIIGVAIVLGRRCLHSLTCWKPVDLAANINDWVVCAKSMWCRNVIDMCQIRFMSSSNQEPMTPNGWLEYTFDERNDFPSFRPKNVAFPSISWTNWV